MVTTSRHAGIGGSTTAPVWSRPLQQGGLQSRSFTPTRLRRVLYLRVRVGETRHVSPEPATGKCLERAEDFIWRNARLLERSLFAHLFGRGSSQAILSALRAYRNLDGGFGHALEPDVRAPDSMPLHTELALRALNAAGVLDPDLALGLVRLSGIRRRGQRACSDRASDSSGLPARVALGAGCVWRKLDQPDRRSGRTASRAGHQACMACTRNPVVLGPFRGADRGCSRDRRGTDLPRARAGPRSRAQARGGTGGPGGERLLLPGGSRGPPATDSRHFSCARCPTPWDVTRFPTSYSRAAPRASPVAAAGRRRLANLLRAPESRLPPWNGEAAGPSTPSPPCAPTPRSEQALFLLRGGSSA